MSEPRRLKDDEALLPLAKTLLKSASLDGPASGAKDRAHVALLGGLGGGGGGQSGGPAAVAGAAGAGAAAKLGTLSSLWFGVAVMGSVLGVGVYGVATTDGKAPVAVTAESASSDSTKAVAPMAPPPERTSEPPLPPETPSAEAASEPALAPHPTPSPSSLKRSTAEQLSLVDAARMALARHETARALATLDDLDRRFPRGEFAEEAAVLRIEALMGAGNADQRERAQALAARFLTAHPKSAYAKRVRSILGKTP
jgi:hypothetical protein